VQNGKEIALKKSMWELFDAYMQIADLREAIRWNLISPYQWKIHNDSLKFEDVKKDIFITL